jgi:hypothetical protein
VFVREVGRVEIEEVVFSSGPMPEGIFR